MTTQKTQLLLTTALLVSLAVSGCTDAAAQDEEAHDDVYQYVPAKPDELQYNETAVSDDGGLVTSEDVSLYCESAFNSTVEVNETKTFHGSAHAHDEWGGADSMVIFDGEVTEFAGGGWFRPDGAAVVPGAGRAEFQVTWEAAPTDAVTPQTRELLLDLPDDDKNTTGSNPLALKFTQNADTEVHSVDFTWAQNDAPHAERTRWSFRESDSEPFNLKWTIFRAYDCLPVDPPHYDAWQDREYILQWQGSTDHTGSSTSMVRGPSFYGFTHEGELLPPGAGIHRVTLTWTPSHSLPVAFDLEYNGADQPGCWGFNACSSSTIWTRIEPTYQAGNTAVFDIEVQPDEPDSPYAQSTGWSYRFAKADTPHPVLEQYMPGNDGTADWTFEVWKAGATPPEPPL